MISITSVPSDDVVDFVFDFDIDDQDSSYFEDEAWAAQDCAEYQAYVWGD